MKKEAHNCWGGGGGAGGASGANVTIGGGPGGGSGGPIRGGGAAPKTPVQATTTVGTITTSAWGILSRAAEFGTKTYRDMRTALQGTGLQAHHIVEQRFGLDVDVTVAVTRAEHQIFTNAWRAQIPFGSMDVTYMQVWEAAKVVYANFPAILEIIRLALGV